MRSCVQPISIARPVLYFTLICIATFALHSTLSFAQTTAPATQPASTARIPHAPPAPGQTLEMSIKELGNFEYDAESGKSVIPDDVKRLDGCRIRLRGFMVAVQQSEQMTQFALVPNLFACCFGQPPQVQHTVVVDCPTGKSVGYFPTEIVVEGTLRVKEEKDDGYVVSLFHVREASVSEVKP